MNASKTVVGIDIAKRVFQLHWVDMETGEIVRSAIEAREVPATLRQPGALSDRHGSLRGCTALGTATDGPGPPGEADAGNSGQPFVGGNKSDAHDARAVWTAVQQPNIKAVAVKTRNNKPSCPASEANNGQNPHRSDQRTAGSSTEYGEVMPQGKVGVKKGIAETLQRLRIDCRRW